MSCPLPKVNKLLRLYGPAYLHSGASIPPTTMALRHSHDSPFPATPHPHPPHPRKQLLDILYAILCNFMRVFSHSVNFGSWQSGIMTPKKWKKYINWVGKTYCICKLMIKRNRASVASENFFEKMIGRLYKPNTCLNNFLFIPPPQKNDHGAFVAIGR